MECNRRICLNNKSNQCELSGNEAMTCKDRSFSGNLGSILSFFELKEPYQECCLCQHGDSDGNCQIAIPRMYNDVCKHDKRYVHRMKLPKIQGEVTAYIRNP